MDTISNLKSKRASRKSDVNTKFIKFGKAILAPILCRLFNACIAQGIFPECLKIAEVVPIFKKGDQHKTSNYRPISLLSHFDKIFEKIIYTRLITYLNKYHLLNDCQFGFRKNYSTTMAVSNIYDKLIKNIEQNLYSCCLFLDLSKAFDTVDHKILLTKMRKNFGIRGVTLELFRSYLSDRYQYTNVMDSLSSQKRSHAVCLKAPR